MVQNGERDADEDERDDALGRSHGLQREQLKLILCNYINNK